MDALHLTHIRVASDLYKPYCITCFTRLTELVRYHTYIKPLIQKSRHFTTQPAKKFVQSFRVFYIAS